MRTYLLVLGFFCLLTVGLVTVWHQVDTLRVGYDVSRIRRQVEDLHRDCDRLTVSITGRKSPPRIERVARRYGLALMRPSEPGAPPGAMTRSTSDSNPIIATTGGFSEAVRVGRQTIESRVAGPGPGYPEMGRTVVGWVNTRGLTGRP